MNASDVLFRNSLPSDTNTVSKDTEHFINNIVSDVVPLSVSLDKIKSETLSDPDLCSIIHSVNTNFWDKKILTAFYRVRNDLIVKNSVLLKSNSLVIPKLLRKRILDIAHQHHFGIVKTKGLLREKVWWPGTDQGSTSWSVPDHQTFSLNSLIKSCYSCQVTIQANNISMPVTPTEIPEDCWDTLAIDLQGPYPTGDYLLALIDYRSRYPCVMELKHVTTRKIIIEFDKVFKLFGYPRKLVFDTGQQFRSKEFQEYLRQNDIKLHKITPYSPWENGETERFNRCLKKVNQCAHAETKIGEKS